MVAALLECIAALAAAGARIRCHFQLLQFIFPEPSDGFGTSGQRPENAIAAVVLAVGAQWSSVADRHHPSAASSTGELQAAVCAVLHLAAALPPLINDARQLQGRSPTVRQRSCVHALLAPLVAPDGLLLQLLGMADPGAGSTRGRDNAFSSAPAIHSSSLRLEALRTSVAVFGAQGICQLLLNSLEFSYDPGPVCRKIAVLTVLNLRGRAIARACP